MKKITVLLVLMGSMVPLQAMDIGNGLTLGGGVKTGLELKNRDYGGKLGDIALSAELAPTLYFASHENDARNGEGWLNTGYSRAEDWGKWGLQLGIWAHGNIEQFEDALHLGDHYAWANFYEDRFRFIGGQGGGTPISSGGWINADWLSYTGLRFFWVDPSGISLGINFPDPGDDELKPVNYLSMIMAGASYRYNNWWISLQFDNSPVYDDSDANYNGGLHRINADPIAEAGNVAFGVGLDTIYNGSGFFAFDGLVTNLGEDEREGRGNYKVSPVQTVLALKAGYPVTGTLYTELKGKYTISHGDNDDDSAAVYWGLAEIEPYASYQAFEHIKFDLAVYGAFYINSYYLALEYSSGSAAANQILPGQVPGYSWLLDYLSPYYFKIKPGVTFSLGGFEVVLGYEGGFSRDHVENTLFIDSRWSF